MPFRNQRRLSGKTLLVVGACIGVIAIALYYCPGKKFVKGIEPDCHGPRIVVHGQQT